MATTGASPEQHSQLTDESRVVSVHHSSPDRVVFTESDNTDGWIATDTTVDLRR